MTAHQRPFNCKPAILNFPCTIFLAIRDRSVSTIFAELYDCRSLSPQFTARYIPTFSPRAVHDCRSLFYLPKQQSYTHKNEGAQLTLISVRLPWKTPSIHSSCMFSMHLDGSCFCIASAAAAATVQLGMYRGVHCSSVSFQGNQLCFPSLFHFIPCIQFPSVF